MARVLNAGRAHMANAAISVPPVSQREYDVHVFAKHVENSIVFCVCTVQYVERTRQLVHVRVAALNAATRSQLVYALEESVRPAMLIHAIVEPYY